MPILGMWFEVPKLKIIVDNLEFSNILIGHLKEEIDSIIDMLDSNNVPASIYGCCGMLNGCQWS